jgi:hypothetical protein
MDFIKSTGRGGQAEDSLKTYRVTQPEEKGEDQRVKDPPIAGQQSEFIHGYLHIK